MARNRDRAKSELFHSVDNQSGTLLANDQMGLTVFDLFGEILTVSDMENYLSKNSINVNDFPTTSALAIRCFLLLLDTSDVKFQRKDENLEIDVEMVKTEIMECDAMETIENIEPDFYMPIELSEQSSKKKDNRGKFKVRRSRQGLNLCKGPGCYCGQSFSSKQAKEQHYIEKGCYKCSTCGEAHVSMAALTKHAGKFLNKTLFGFRAGEKTFEKNPTWTGSPAEFIVSVR